MIYPTHHKSAEHTDLLHVRRVVLTRELGEVNHLLVGDARRKIPGRVVCEASAALCKNTHMTVQEVVRRLGTCMSLCNVIPQTMYAKGEDTFQNK